MSTPSTSAHDGHQVEGSLGVAALRRPFEALGFWAAVGLPFVYMPILLTGMQTPAEQYATVLLIAAHVVALVLGRHHKAN